MQLRGEVQPTNLAYVIYTSGSTGQPKGVLLDHRGRVNNFYDFKEQTMPVQWNANVFGSSQDLSNITGVRGYGARGLVCALPRQDLLQLWSDLRKLYAVIARHYKLAGIEILSEAEIIWDDSYIPPRPGYELRTFMFFQMVHEVCPDQRWLDASIQFNNKNWFMRFCSEYGYPTPFTQVYEKGVLPDKNKSPLPCYVKHPGRTTGGGLFPCQTWDEVLSAVATVDSDYQTQELIPNPIALNVQWEMTPNGPKYLITTEQLLKDDAHIGNRSTWKFGKAKTMTYPIAQKAWEMGLKGIIGFDVLVFRSSTTGKLIYLILECNARFQGSTYYFIAARRLGVKHWKGLNIKIRPDLDLAQIVHLLESNDYTIKPDRLEGVLIVNWGIVLSGEIGLLIAGNRRVQERYLEKVVQLISPRKVTMRVFDTTKVDA